MTEPRRVRASDQERDTVLRALQEAHGAGRLDLVELDERQARVMEARYLDELTPVVADLPEGDDLFAGREVAARASSRSLARVATGDPAITRLTMMGGRTTTVEPGTTRISNFVMWGGSEIDLTECMGPGVTVTVDSANVMGGSKIIVPEGVRVIDKTIPFMGGSGVDHHARGDGSNGTLVVRGLAFWGGQSVHLADGHLADGAEPRARG